MKKYLLIFAVAAVAFSCGDDDEPADPVIPNEEELITTVKYMLTPDTGAAVELTFVDLDGDGGNDPVITGGTIKKDVSYAGALTFLNEEETPAEDITIEIKDEDEEHQVFFQTSFTGLTVTYDDADADNNPLGLESTLISTDTGSAQLTITLRHEPDKNASGVSDGDITNAGGETDIEVTFDIEIED